jgi:hypothetical protein
MAIESQGTTLEIETGTGGAVTITDISVGYPTILTAVAHGLTAGDVVALADFAGADAATLNGESAVVQFVTTDTFAVRIDTTGDTITDNTDAATATPASYTAIGEVIDFDGPGGSASVIDTTHLTSTAKEKMIGLADEGQFTFSLNAAFDNAGQSAFRTSRTARTRKHYKVTYSDATVQMFYGYAMAFSTSGGVDDKVNASATIEIDGAATTA